jgi:hypothetical protein
MVVEKATLRIKDLMSIILRALGGGNCPSRAPCGGLSRCTVE